MVPVDKDSEASRLLMRLTDGSAKQTKESKNAFWEDLDAFMTNVIEKKRRGEKVPNLETIILVLMQFSGMSVFRSKRRKYVYHVLSGLIFILLCV